MMDRNRSEFKRRQPRTFTTSSGRPLYGGDTSVVRVKWFRQDLFRRRGPTNEKYPADYMRPRYISTKGHWVKCGVEDTR